MLLVGTLQYLRASGPDLGSRGGLVVGLDRVWRAHTIGFIIGLTFGFL